MFKDGLVEMWGCIPNIICIAQITRESENNALLIYDWRLYFFWLEILFQFLADENRFNDRRKDLVGKIKDRRKDFEAF